MFCPYGAAAIASYLSLEMRRATLEVLLVDDSSDDIEVFSLAVARAHASIHMASVVDGEKGLQYLRQEPPYADAKTPDVVILDINLPKKTGIEVLEEMKHDRRLRSIPVVMLSTSDSPEGIGESYCRGASCYLIKPDDFQGWTSLIDSVAKFWTRADFACGYTCP